MKKILIAAAAAVAAIASYGANGTITTENGESQKGEIRWSARDKAYVIVKGGIEIQIKATDVSEIDIDEPAGYAAAVAQVQKGQGAAAIPALQKIVKDYAHLQWDKSAGRYLAEAYISAGKADDGFKACQAIISSDPAAAYKGELAPAYWNALLALGKTPQLESALAKAAKSGDRFSSASALTMRGDMILKNGNESPDACKQALSDGYLRVVLLYRDTPAVQPEALYKAARCFEKLGQSGRADSMRTTLKSQYSSSAWASK